MAGKKSSKGGAVSNTAPRQPAPAALPEGFKVKRQVILPSLSLQEGVARTLTILEAMRVSTVKAARPRAKGEKDDGPQKPATVCPVVDVTTGENFTLIVPAVMEGNLRENYPDDGYVGKTFYVQKKPKRPGKRYFDLELSEVEPA